MELYDFLSETIMQKCRLPYMWLATAAINIVVGFTQYYHPVVPSLWKEGFLPYDCVPSLPQIRITLVTRVDRCTTRVVLPSLGFTKLKSQGPLFPVHWWLPNLIWLMAPNDLMERTHQNLKIQPEDIKCRPWVHGWNSPHRRRLLAGHSQR
jgi:hypothetical protein